MSEFGRRFISPFTTYRIGGEAKSLVIAYRREQLLEALDYENCVVIGRGSKLLVSDKGFDGRVIVNRVSACSFDGDFLVADSGAGLPELSRRCCLRGLSGLEWACSLPASVGGAVYMNAGAFDKSMADVVEYVDVLYGGKEVRLAGSDCGFGYRQSVFMRGGYVILRVGLRLNRTDFATVNNAIKGYAARRAGQPRGLSCGSIFKAAEKPAALYIDRLGLKGLRYGGAEISPLHANFIMNTGGAKARDVYTLIRAVKAEVYNAYGIRLREEVRYLGEF